MENQANVSSTSRPASPGPDQWRELVAEWSASGLTQTAFCRQRAVSVTAFYWWRRKLSKHDARPWGGRRGRRRGPRRATSEVFREVRIDPPAESLPALGQAAGMASYEVVVAGGRRIRIGRDFDPQVLGRLIVALEAMPGTSPC